MKNKIYKILLVILIIVAIIIGAIIFKKQYNDNVYDKENREIATLFHKQQKESNIGKNNENEEVKTIDLEYKGYKVIGLIEIPAIELDYPIIEKTTQNTMNISISRFAGGDVNEYGNISLAGHNNYNGTMFGKNNKLKNGDKIILTDLTGRIIEYEIYKIFTTNPNDTTILETEDENIREVTLITCKNGRSNRLIIKAREII